MPRLDEVRDSLPLPFQADILDDAAAICREDFDEVPGQSARWRALGLLTWNTAAREFSLACLERAIALAPDDVTSYVCLNETLSSASRHAESVPVSLQAVRLTPKAPELRVGLAQALAGQGHAAAAIAVCRESLQLDASPVAIYTKLGQLYATKGLWRDATAAFEEAIRQEPGRSDAYGLLGSIQVAQGDFVQARETFRKGLELDEFRSDLHTGLGTALLRVGLMSEAVCAYRRAAAIAPLDVGICESLVFALELQPDREESASAWYRLGLALVSNDREPEAIAAFLQALARKPTHLNALVHLGQTLLHLNRLQEARRYFETAVQVKPDSRHAHVGLGFVAQAEGNLQQGWQEFRWYQRDDAELGREFDRPLWDGAPLRGGTILLWADWALGDAIHFLRYVPLVRALCARVVVECDRRLVSLVRTLTGADEVVARRTALPSFDAHAPLFSLPRIFNTSLASIPAKVPYFAPDARLKNAWRARLGRRGPLTVGIVWSGEPSRGKARFTSLATFAPLLRVRGVRFISLQLGAPTVELLLQPSGALVESLLSETVMAEDTAAVIHHLDVVITVDTMVAHLVGALGIPVWVLLSYAPCWRWQCRADFSPWYPTMRLFRQDSPGDWSGVVDMVRLAMNDVIR